MILKWKRKDGRKGRWRGWSGRGAGLVLGLLLSPLGRETTAANLIIGHQAAHDLYVIARESLPSFRKSSDPGNRRPNAKEIVEKPESQRNRGRVPAGKVMGISPEPLPNGKEAAPGQILGGVSGSKIDKTPPVSRQKGDYSPAGDTKIEQSINQPGGKNQELPADSGMAHLGQSGVGQSRLAKNIHFGEPMRHNTSGLFRLSGASQLSIVKSDLKKGRPRYPATGKIVPGWLISPRFLENTPGWNPERLLFLPEKNWDFQAEREERASQRSTSKHSTRFSSAQEKAKARLPKQNRGGTPCSRFSGSGLDSHSGLPAGEGSTVRARRPDRQSPARSTRYFVSVPFRKHTGLVGPKLPGRSRALFRSDGEKATGRNCQMTARGPWGSAWRRRTGVGAAVRPNFNPTSFFPLRCWLKQIHSAKFGHKYTLDILRSNYHSLLSKSIFKCMTTQCMTTPGKRISQHIPTG